MNHRQCSGTIGYFHRRTGETGREHFTITHHRDGSRVLRALCEMDDDQVLRDVTYAIGEDGRPHDAFVRLTVADHFVGSTWFTFEPESVACEALTAAQGRFTQKLSFPGGAPCFGTHSLITDGWHGALWRVEGPEEQCFRSPVCSQAANGATGPMLSIIEFSLQRIGTESVHVPAGEFECSHFLINFGAYPPMHFWISGDDHQVVRIEWDYLDAYYELMSYRLA